MSLAFLLLLFVSPLGCGKGGNSNSTTSNVGGSSESHGKDRNNESNTGDNSAPGGTDTKKDDDRNSEATPPNDTKQLDGSEIKPSTAPNSNWFVGAWVTRDRKVTIYHGNGFVERKVGIAIQRQRFEATHLKDGEVLLSVKNGENDFQYQIIKRLEMDRLIASSWSKAKPYGALSNGQGVEWRMAYDEITKNGVTGPRVMKEGEPSNHLKIGDGVLVPAFAMRPWPPLDSVPISDALIRIEPLENPFIARLVLDPPAEGKPNISHFYYSQNGRLAVATAQDGLNGDWWIGVWELTTKSPIGLFHVFNRIRPAIAISDNGAVVAAKIGNRVLVYDGNSTTPWIPPALADLIHLPPAVSSDGKRIAFHWEGGYQVWNSVEKKLEVALNRETLVGKNKSVDLTRHMDFMANGEILIFTSGSLAATPISYRYVSSADWSLIHQFPRNTKIINHAVFNDARDQQTMFVIKGNSFEGETRKLAGKQEYGSRPLTARFSLLGRTGFGGNSGWFLVDRLNGTSTKFEPKRGVSNPLVTSNNDTVVGFQFLDNFVEVWDIASTKTLGKFDIPKDLCKLNGVPGGSHRLAASNSVSLLVEQGHAVLLSFAQSKATPAPTAETKPEPKPDRVEWLWAAGKARIIPKVSARTAKREDYLTVAAVHLDEFAEKNARAKLAFLEQKTGSKTLDAIKAVGELLPTNERLEMLNMAATLAAFEFAANSIFKRELHDTNRYLKQRGFDEISEKEQATLKLLASQDKWPKKKPVE